MFESGYYPEGTEFNNNSPWNEKVHKDREIEVVVSITMSKSFKIYVNDYEESEGVDDENHKVMDVDYSNCDLKRAVEEQINLPQDAYKQCLVETKLYNDLKDWDIDEFEVIKE